MLPLRQLQTLPHHRPHVRHHRILLISLDLFLLVARHRMSHPLLLSFLGASVAFHRTLPPEIRRPSQAFGGYRCQNQSLVILNLGLALKMRKDPHVDGLFDQGRPINSSHIGSIVYSTNNNYGGIPML